MADTNSTATSLEDRTEDLDSGENPTRDTLAEGLLSLIRPTIDSLESQVSSTLGAQADLKDQICSLQRSLRSLQEQQQCPVELDSYINKLNNTRKRVSVVAKSDTIKERDIKISLAAAKKDKCRLKRSNAIRPWSTLSVVFAGVLIISPAILVAFCRIRKRMKNHKGGKNKEIV